MNSDGESGNLLIKPKVPLSKVTGVHLARIHQEALNHTISAKANGYSGLPYNSGFIEYAWLPEIIRNVCQNKQYVYTDEDYCKWILRGLVPELSCHSVFDDLQNNHIKAMKDTTSERCGFNHNSWYGQNNCALSRCLYYGQEIAKIPRYILYAVPDDSSENPIIFPKDLHTRIEEKDIDMH